MSLSEVRSILDKQKLNYTDYLALLSDSASEILEELALKAQELTRKFFGKTILLYAPLYLCNECDSHCVYCGFSQRSNEKKVCLTVDQALSEADVLYAKGFRHILLVSGEKRDKVTIDYLKEIVKRLHKKFDSISIEIFPLEENEYRELFSAGVDGVTIYQEVYDRDIYAKMHPRGPKSDYDYRFQTPERAAKAGFYKINIGTLLGLGEWKQEAAMVGKHADDLKKKFWRSQLAVSFPRIKGSNARFSPPNPVTDRQLVQMICALRIYQPTMGLVLSTREPAELRDSLIPLGITQMSAESKTSPGAYASKLKAEEQFDIADKRSLDEVALSISKKGYEPVFKDWDKSYIEVQ